MQFISPDLRERSRFIDRGIEETITALKHPDVSLQLGVMSIYQSMLENAVIANVSDEGIDLPEDHSDDQDSLLIAAIRKEDNTLILPSLDVQTTTQKKYTILKLKTWGASSPESMHDSLFGSRGVAAPLGMNGLMRAMTGMFGDFTDMSAGWLRRDLPNLQGEGLLQVNKRPFVVFRMDGETKMEPDLFAHELIHVRQYTNRPVVVSTSQRSVNMHDLRNELEAYHVGSVLGFVRDGKDQVKLIIEDGRTDRSQTQMIVNAVRVSFGVDDLDPYRPSPKLLAEFQSLGLEGILHQGYDFDAIKTKLNTD